RQAGKAHDMHDRRTVAVQIGHQFLRRTLLMTPGERPDHPPMAALKITSPRAAAFGLQELFLRPAELPQVRVAGDDDSLPAARVLARILRKDLANQAPVCFPVGWRPGWIEPCIAEELSGGADDDK